jgi:hypothetical protein
MGLLVELDIRDAEEGTQANVSLKKDCRANVLK